MGTYTDAYVEMLQEDLQHQYRRCFEVGTDLAQALQASEGKDLEISTMKNFLDSSEVTLSDALRTVSVRDIEIERLTNELEIARRTIENLDTNSCVLYSENQRLETQFGAVKTLLDTERNTTAQVEKKLGDALGVLSDRDIEIERLTFALKDKDNELESVRDEHRTQIDELMEEIERLTRKNKKPFKASELRWLIDGHTNVLDAHRTAILEVREAIDQNKETLSAAQREMLATLDRHDALISKAFGCIDNHSDSIYKQQQSIDNLWLYVQGIAAHINTGGTPDGNQD